MKTLTSSVENVKRHNPNEKVAEATISANMGPLYIQNDAHDGI